MMSFLNDPATVQLKTLTFHYEGEKLTMQYKNCQMEIVEVKNKMITLARITRLPEEEVSEEGEEE